MRPFESSLASSSIGTPKLSENKTVRAWSRPKMDNIMLRWNQAQGVDPVSFIYIFSSLPSIRPFGSSLALGSIRTPKLSEFTREQSHDG
ncbi:unnamed protein product [Malus baccata var. baccata]